VVVELDRHNVETLEFVNGEIELNAGWEKDGWQKNLECYEPSTGVGGVPWRGTLWFLAHPT
jgi:hypothetical protein